MSIRKNNKSLKGEIIMITVKFGVIRENLELLYNILKEASDYGIWSVFYGEEEIDNLKSILNKVSEHRLEIEKNNKENVQLQLTFKEAQVLKKVVVFYLTNNFKNLRRSQFEKITDFILFIDDSLAFELEDKGIE
jgi:hypothetical protein